jgi:phospholipid/cholesterol/gamma-HCH transport system substrate-binding protein
MSLRRLVGGALAAVVIAIVLVVVLTAGGSAYHVKLRLANADGLRDGTPVEIAGIDVGNVSLSVDPRRKVIVDMTIDRSHAPVGRDATATIAAVNLLGQKRVRIAVGNRRHPAPSGYVIPTPHVTKSTDLDQVLDVLTPNTRARLGILINAAGAALTGRRADFSHVLHELPGAFAQLDQLAGQLSTDNHTLTHLVQTSDGFVSEMADRRHELDRLVDTVGQTGTTLADKRTQLLATLARAPETLVTLQRFLAKLRGTTVPLGPAARDITDTAPELTATLKQVDPFRVAADPTLHAATAVAPQLTHLARGATPVLRRADPVARSLASLAPALAPVSHALDHSADNVVAILQNWSRAIQFRDGLSHVFRGEASVSPQYALSLINRLESTQHKRSASSSSTARHQHSRGHHATSERSRPSPLEHSGAANGAPSAAHPRHPSPHTGGGGVPGLLHRVLGGLADPHSDSPNPQQRTTPTASASPPPLGGVVGSLLHYLLGP